MASIEKRHGKDGFVWRVRLRKEGKQICKTFFDEYTACLYVKYMEVLCNEQKHFDVPKEDLFTPKDALLSKYGEASKEYKSTIGYFETIENIPLSEISYDDLEALAKKLLSIKIARGGCGGTGGRVKYPELQTILRKFAHLSAGINHLISKGSRFENNSLKVIKFLRNLKENPYKKE